MFKISNNLTEMAFPGQSEFDFGQEKTLRFSQSAGVPQGFKSLFAKRFHRALRLGNLGEDDGDAIGFEEVFHDCFGPS